MLTLLRVPRFPVSGPHSSRVRLRLSLSLTLPRVLFSRLPEWQSVVLLSRCWRDRRFWQLPISFKAGPAALGRQGQDERKTRPCCRCAPARTPSRFPTCDGLSPLIAAWLVGLHGATRKQRGKGTWPVLTASSLMVTPIAGGRFVKCDGGKSRRGGWRSRSSLYSSSFVRTADRRLNAPQAAVMRSQAY
jgi:hypothetical protein